MTTLLRSIVPLLLLGLSGGAFADAAGDCDRLAGHPEDPARTAAGAWNFQLRSHLSAALGACAAAVQQTPNARLLYEYGRALAAAQDPQAVTYLIVADNQSYPMAAYQLGLLYDQGSLVAADAPTARAYYSRAAAGGVGVAEDALGYALVWGTLGGQDTAQGLALMQQGAAHGSLMAVYDLAGAYYNGAPGLSQQCPQALAYYAQAAQAGLPFAQNDLGWLYDMGQCTASSQTQALAWYQAAADQGFAPAEANAGELYHAGSGTARDDARALALFRAAADQNGDSGQRWGQLGELSMFAEFAYADAAPYPGSIPQTYEGFVFRHYAASGNYIGILDGHLYALGPVVGNQIADLGNVGDWINVARGQGF